jgi:hypothetical protein
VRTRHHGSLVVVWAAVTATVLTKSVGPGGRGENPSSGADHSARVGRREVASGRALEALFDPGPGDDVAAIAEAEFRLQRTLLVPQLV